MNPVVITPPDGYPLSPDDVKGQVQVQSSDFDAKIGGLIAAATAFVETYTGKALLTRTYRGFMDGWPVPGAGPAHHLGQVDHWCGPQARAFELPWPPLQSVTSITTYDDSDLPTVMDPAGYYVDASSLVGRVVRRNNTAWPTVYRAANGIAVQWVAGFGVAGDVPADFKQAMLLLVSHWFEHTEAVVGVDARDSSTVLPLGVPALLDPYRIYSFG